MKTKLLIELAILSFNLLKIFSKTLGKKKKKEEINFQIGSGSEVTAQL